MNYAYGKLIGSWIGDFKSVDVDDDGIAWGEELRIRVAIRVDQPLLRGVRIRESEEQVVGSWFDLKYERIPHFCFDCGLLVHPNDTCLAEKHENKQWGEWLRASPGKKKKPAFSQRPSVTSGSFSSRSGESDPCFSARIRDLPPRRNLFRDYSVSESSRTGGVDHRREREEVRSPPKNHRVHENAGRPTREDGPARKPKTYVRRPRQKEGENPGAKQQAPSSPVNRKRRTKQVWQVKNVQSSPSRQCENDGKRQRTSSVFDRLEENLEAAGASGVAGENVNSVFNRLERTPSKSADPAMRGRRTQ
jgi:hypothetical protein